MGKDMDVQTVISRICQKIKETYHPEKTILFGSYAYDRPTGDSDIDLFIIKDGSRRPIERNVEIRCIVSEENRRIALTPYGIYTGGGPR